MQRNSPETAKNGNNVERVYREISSFRQSRSKLNLFNLFRLCRKDEISLDIIAETGNNNVASTLLPYLATMLRQHCCQKNGNNVEVTFDFVERIVRLVAFDNVTSAEQKPSHGLPMQGRAG